MRLPELFGGISGRHLRTLAMYTSARDKAIASIILVSNWPAKPTKGSPCRSSSAPGASPTNINSASGFPTPKTTGGRVRASTGHLVQTSTGPRIACNRSALPRPATVRAGGGGGTGSKGSFATIGATGAATAGTTSIAPIAAIPARGADCIGSVAFGAGCLGATASFASDSFDAPVCRPRSRIAASDSCTNSSAVSKESMR